MGNKSATAFVTGDDEEFHSAPRLLTAITTNSEKTVHAAIDAARAKCTKDLDYEPMIKKMHKYLTQKYQCREIDRKKLTPLEYAKDLGADHSEKVIRDAINELEKNMSVIEAAASESSAAKKSKTFLHNLMRKDDYEAHGTEAPPGILGEQHPVRVAKDEVTTERVIQAKTRLQAFQAERKANASDKKR